MLCVSLYYSHLSNHLQNHFSQYVTPKTGTFLSLFSKPRWWMIGMPFSIPNCHLFWLMVKKLGFSYHQNSEYSKIFDLILFNGITKNLMLMIVLNLDVDVDWSSWNLFVWPSVVYLKVGKVVFFYKKEYHDLSLIVLSWC